MLVKQPYSVKSFLSICCLLPLIGALCNSDLFGPTTLLSYFSFTILASLICIPLLAVNWTQNEVRVIRVHIGGLIFVLLCCYVCMHGTLMQGVTLTHYYWAVAGCWLICLNAFFSTEDKLNGNRFMPIHFGVIVIAVLESLVVVFQWLQILPSKNPLFSCTGTWENPNVTALFLALSLYSVIQTEPAFSQRRPRARTVALLVLGCAILLLRCRTAYIVTGILGIVLFSHELEGFVKGRSKRSKHFLARGLLVIVIGIVGLLVFKVKKGSTSRRISVWQMTMAMVESKPLAGYGFGSFEKEFNVYTVGNHLPDNDHVSMPYNDYLELAMEGGLPAMLLWAGFVVTLYISSRSDAAFRWLSVAFTIMQLVNFCFQAIPVFSLFLLYAAMNMAGKAKWKLTVKKHLFGVVMLMPCSFLLWSQFRLSEAFKARHLATQEYTSSAAISAYKDLSPVLKGFSSFHEAYGDAGFQVKDYKVAVLQYRLALQSCSHPGILLKCGDCYKMLDRSDSSEYYYKMAECLQPYRFVPRFRLLRLYEARRDTGQVLAAAKDIANLPVRIPSEEVDRIKVYAAAVSKALNDKLSIK